MIEVDITTIPKKNVALVYDADYTLLDGYHPSLILESRGIDIEGFWKKVSETQRQEVEKGERTSLDIIYLAHFMNEVRHGKLKGLSIREIREIGKNLEKMLYPGLPEFFTKIKDANPNLRLSHNVVSVGIKPLLEGSCIAPYLDSIFGYTFFDNLTEGQEIDEIKSTTSAQEKIPALVGISYGKAEEKQDWRRFQFPLENMIYLGDGQTDRAAFRYLKRYKGTPICVYDARKQGALEKARKFENDVNAILSSDYRVGGEIWEYLNTQLKRIESREEEGNK